MSGILDRKLFFKPVGERHLIMIKCVHSPKDCPCLSLKHQHMAEMMRDRQRMQRMQRNAANGNWQARYLLSLRGLATDYWRDYSSEILFT